MSSAEHVIVQHESMLMLWLKMSITTWCIIKYMLNKNVICLFVEFMSIPLDDRKVEHACDLFMPKCVDDEKYISGYSIILQFIPYLIAVGLPDVLLLVPGSAVKYVAPRSRVPVHQAPGT